MSEALMDALIGAPAKVSAREESRIRSQLQVLNSSKNPALVLSDLLADRGRKVRLSAHPDDLDDIKGDSRVLLSGAHLREFGLAGGSVVEGYVEESALEALVDDYLLQDNAGGKVIFRLHLPHPEHLLPLAAADLADWGAGRELREADRVVREMLGKAR